MLGLLSLLILGKEYVKEKSEPEVKAFDISKLRDDILNGVDPKIRQQKLRKGMYK